MMINDLNDGIDASSGAFVNDTAPGADGSVLGVNTVPASASVEESAGQSYPLTAPARDRTLMNAAVGGGLLAIGLAFFGSLLWPRRSRSFLGFGLRRRARRWSFSRQ